jgi:hypothetical protein
VARRNAGQRQNIPFEGAAKTELDEHGGGHRILNKTSNWFPTTVASFD